LFLTATSFLANKDEYISLYALSLAANLNLPTLRKRDDQFIDNAEHTPSDV